MPACDAVQPEDDVSFRCIDLDSEVDVDENLVDENLYEEEEGEPLPLPAVTKGGPTINCPECGSHWTTDGGVVAIYLEGPLSPSMRRLVKTGTFRHGGFRGFVAQDFEGPDGDVTLEIHRYANRGPSPECTDQGHGVLRTLPKSGFLDTGLHYVNNDDGEFEDPPVLP